MKNLWIKFLTISSIMLSIASCSSGGDCSNCNPYTGVRLSAANDFAFSTTTSAGESTQVTITNSTNQPQSGVFISLPNNLFSIEPGLINSCTLTGSATTYIVTNTLASGGSCQFTLSYYANQATIASTANIIETTGDGVASKYPVTFVTTQTMLTITPQSYSFGNIYGSTESKIESFTVFNVNSNQPITGVTESIINESYFLIVNQSEPNDCSTLASNTLNGGASCVITVLFNSTESVVTNILESSFLQVGYTPYLGATPILPANGINAILSGTVLSLDSPNIVVKLISLIPVAAIGNGSQSPNQWQVLLNTNPESLVITYENIGLTNAVNFSVITSVLSSGYTLESNGCNGVLLESNDSNVCSILLGVATSPAGEEDLALTPLTFSFSGDSLAEPTVWVNPFAGFTQDTVFVNIIESSVNPIVLAESPAIYGFAGVTNADPSVITGDVDAGPGATSITGFPPGIITGAFYVTPAAEAVAAENLASSSFTNAIVGNSGCLSSGAYPAVGGRNLSGKDLGSISALPGGIYCFSSSAGLTGTLTLDGGESAVYVFQIYSTLTTASGSKVVLTNGTQYRNIYWAVGLDGSSGASFGTNSAFAGIVDAYAAITDAGGSIILGNLWSRQAAVTLKATTITP